MTRKIMIVDDDQEFLDELEEALFLSGFETVALKNTEFAVDTALQTKPDIILMDLKMPGKSGFQLADEMHHIAGLESIPIVAMSGSFTKVEHTYLMDVCGIKRFFKKPFNLSDIISSVVTIVSEKDRGKQKPAGKFTL